MTKPKLYELGEKKKRFTVEAYLKYVDDDYREKAKEALDAAFERHEFAPFVVMPGKRMQMPNGMMYVEPVEVDRPEGDK